MKPSIKDAVELWNKGQLNEALLLLKNTERMSAKDARDAILAAIEESTKVATGAGQDEEASIKEALGLSETFDELTILMLRQMRKDGLPVSRSTEGVTPQVVLEKCFLIYDSMRYLLEHDVNTYRAMTAYITQVQHDASLRRSQDDAADVQLMKDAIKKSLRDDLLDLL
jgi:hypothetical protein